MAMASNQTTSGVNWLTGDLLVYSNGFAGFDGIFNAAPVSTAQMVLGQGRYSATVSALPQSIAFSQIHDAVRRNDAGQVKALLQQDPTLVFSKANDGDTPLHWAVDRGQKETTELLLANQADVNAKGKVGQSPLHYAAVNGSRILAELLLREKAEVDARSNAGETPLHWAADGGQKDVVQLLLANKADINAKDRQGRTPLHHALHGTRSNAAGKKYSDEDRKTVATMLRQEGGAGEWI